MLDLIVIKWMLMTRNTTIIPSMVISSMHRATPWTMYAFIVHNKLFLNRKLFVSIEQPNRILINNFVFEWCKSIFGDDGILQ